MPSPLPPAQPPGRPPDRPFVLLDDASGPEGTGSLLYTDPLEIVVARRVEEVRLALGRLRVLAAQGRHLAGYLAYEAGLALEPRLAPLAAARVGADGPLLWFGAFAPPTRMDFAGTAAWLAAHGERQGCALGPLQPRISPGAYARAFGRIHEAILAGDIYQANLTFPLEGSWQGDPLAIFAGLRGAGGGAHGALVHDGSHWLLSHSPELFLTLEAGVVTLRPMKGTRPRGGSPAEDAALAAELAASPKDRAENLMILDLMRNDLSRVAMPGSVTVEAPFAVETYPSVHQMVSTVRGVLPDGMGAVDLLTALFPCGSVTGAPKIRAMELLAGVERAPRGAYCGAIGRIDPLDSGGDCAGGAAFNVAIRTLRLSPPADGAKGQAGRAVMGVGSAVVADSQWLAEWRECLVKGGFVQQPPAPGQGGEQADGGSGAVARFDLIETMRFSPEDGIPLLELHLERIKASAAELGFAFDRHAVRNAIQALCFEAEAPSRLRLSLSRSGATCLEIGDLPPAPTGPMGCAVLPLPLDSGDWRLRHKTTDRWVYEAGLRAARAAGGDEALLLRDDGLVTEGCFTNLFVERDGILLTPPARLGLLPGVLRRHLLDEGRAVEAELRLADLAGGFLLGNALRGLMRAELLG